MVNLGVVGLGQMGDRFSRLVAESPRANLSGVTDIDADRCRAVADTWQSEPYPTLEAMLTEADIDGLIIATSDNAHVAPAVEGARAGKHLFVEKPLALTAEDCVPIIDAAAAAGVKLLVGHTLRFDPRYAAARHAIKEGKLGEVVHTFSRRNNPPTILGQYGDRVSVAFFLGIHDIDFLLWAIDAKVSRVFATGRRGVLTGRGLDLDDTIFSILTFDSGVVSCLENSWWVPENVPGRMYTHMFEADGTEGEIHIVPEMTGLTVRGKGYCDYPNAVYSPEVAGKLHGTYYDEIEHFLDCIVDGAEPLAPGPEAMRAVAVVEAIHESMATGLPVDTDI
jgi:predicted dehydrogenase